MWPGALGAPVLNLPRGSCSLRARGSAELRLSWCCRGYGVAQVSVSAGAAEARVPRSGVLSSHRGSNPSAASSRRVSRDCPYCPYLKSCPGLGDPSFVFSGKQAHVKFLSSKRLFHLRICTDRTACSWTVSLRKTLIHQGRVTEMVLK